jgi:hypothetical protein
VALALDTKGVFSFSFNPIFFCFGLLLFLQNGTKRHANFLAKKYQVSILDFDLKRKKKSQKKTLTHSMKNLTF